MKSNGPLDGLGDRFEILRTVGEGASGTVCLARDSQLERRVALKVLKLPGGPRREEHFARFRREVDLLVRFPHPEIVPVLDARLDEEPYYLVVAWMPGGDLRGRIRPGGLGEDEVLEIGARLARALAHLHGHGVLHRDVKPANVLLDERGDAFLADLGLGVAEGESELTRTGILVGTPLYMSREVLEKGEYSPRSDLFALAAVLLELTIGERLSAPASLPRVCNELLERVGDDGLRALLRRCLRSDPDDRPASCGVLGAELEQRIRERSGGAVVPRPRELVSSSEATLTVDLGRPSTEGHAAIRGPTTADGPAVGDRGTRRLPLLPLGAGLLALMLGLAWLRSGGEVAPTIPTPTSSTDGERIDEAYETLTRRLEKLVGPHRTPEGVLPRSLSGDTYDEHQVEVVEEYLDPRYPLRWRRFYEALKAYLEAFPDSAEARSALEQEIEDRLDDAVEHLSKDRAMGMVVEWVARLPGSVLPPGLRHMESGRVADLAERFREVSRETRKALETIPLLKIPPAGPIRTFTHSLRASLDVEEPGETTRLLRAIRTELRENPGAGRERFRQWNAALSYLPETFSEDEIACEVQAEFLREALAYLDAPGDLLDRDRVSLESFMQYRWVSYLSNCHVVELVPRERMRALQESIRTRLRAAPATVAVHLRWARTIETSMSLLGGLQGFEEDLRPIGGLLEQAERLVESSD